jgi:hypothetical protein
MARDTQPEMRGNVGEFCGNNVQNKQRRERLFQIIARKNLTSDQENWSMWFPPFESPELGDAEKCRNARSMRGTLGELWRTLQGEGSQHASQDTTTAIETSPTSEELDNERTIYAPQGSWAY